MVSIVIVTYNSGDQILACLQSVTAQLIEPSPEIIVIDNASSDDTVAKLSRDYPAVHITENAHNRGFAAASNQGIAASSGEAILLLNPDTVIGEGALQASVNFLSETPNSGIVGCSLTNESGDLVESSRKLPTIGSYFAGAVGLREGLGRLRSDSSTIKSANYTQVDMVIGAFFMIARNLIKEIGDLDEQFFIFAEERDYCMRAKSAGWNTYLLNTVTAMHIGGASTRLNQGMMYIERIRSSLLLHRKHDSRLFTYTVWFALLLGAGLRALYWFILSLVTLGDPSRVRKLKVYFSGLWWLVTNGAIVSPRPHDNIVD